MASLFPGISITLLSGGRRHAILHEAFTLYRLLYLLIEVDSPVIHLRIPFLSKHLFNRISPTTSSVGAKSISDKFCFTPKDPLPIKNHHYSNTGEQAKKPISLDTLVHMFGAER